MKLVPRLRMLSLGCLVSVLGFARQGLVLASDDEERLMVDVFKGYNMLLINVDEKDQIMHTNVWLTLKWKDFQMTWNPVNYGGIRKFVLMGITKYLSCAMCHLQELCIIDVEYFPFDEQTCHLIFGSWTYNENEIKLEFEKAEWIDLSEYAPSSIWMIEFQLRIRRKTLFYTVVLIIPTVLMASSPWLYFSYLLIQAKR
uniref:Neurotransmitter-gated ion-channel ligand-binding domain-containing protein n=1 Tax=Ditylenchus dipsaci TaxID=166011 RepID=A0A915ES25_9BILA